MAWTATGTQSGTDTNLSGLSGVSNNQSFSITGDATVTYYRQNAGNLIVSGDLTFSSWYEKILGTATTSHPLIQVANGGSLEITGAGEAITDTKEGQEYNGNESCLQVDMGGSCTLSDCTIATTRNVHFRNSGTGSIRINNTVFRKITNDATQIVRFDLSGTADAIIRCTLDRIGGLFTGIGDFQSIKIKNGGSIDSNHVLLTSQSVYGIGNFDMLFRNVSFSGNTGFYSLKLRNDNTITIRGFDLPIDQIDITGRLGLGNDDQGAVFFERDVSFYIADASGAVEGARIRITDHRGSGDTFSTPVNYDYVTGSDGNAAAQTILAGIANALNASTQAEYDLRQSYGIDDDMNVRMDAEIYSYGHLPSTVTVALVGLDELRSTPPPLGDDDSITEPSYTTALAYTTQETAARAYDHLAAVTVRDYKVSPCTKIADMLDFGSFNVTVQTGTGEVAITSTAVTLNVPTTFLGSIKTTGTVTGVSLITGAVIDSVADSSLTFAGIDAWSVYATETDRDANTNLLNSGTTGNYRFNYSAGTEYFLRLKVSGETTLKSVTPTEAGITIVSLQTAALLTGINSALGYVPRVVFLNTSASSNGSGSAQSPFNSVADAVSYAKANDIHDIHFNGNVTLASDSSGIKWKAEEDGLIVSLNGQMIDQCLFENCIVAGACVISSVAARLDNCVIVNLTGFQGVAQNCLLNGNMQVAGPTSVISCTNGSQVSPQITLAQDITLGIRDWVGEFSLAGVSGTSVVNVSAHSGTITLESTCTAGTITVKGGIDVVDNSTATIIVNDETISARTKAISRDTKTAVALSA